VRKFHLFFALVILSLAVGGCSSPTGIDCEPNDAACLNPGGLGGRAALGKSQLLSRHAQPIANPCDPFEGRGGS